MSKLQEFSNEMLVFLRPRVSSRGSGFPAASPCLWGRSTLHTTLYTPHSTIPQFALYTPHSTLYTLHFTLCTPHSTLYTLNVQGCVNKLFKKCVLHDCISMCFDIITINIRVSIRVRGLHLVFSPQVPLPASRPRN